MHQSPGHTVALKPEIYENSSNWNPVLNFFDLKIRNLRMFQTKERAKRAPALQSKALSGKSSGPETLVEEQAPLFSKANEMFEIYFWNL